MREVTTLLGQLRALPAPAAVLLAVLAVTALVLRVAATFVVLALAGAERTGAWLVGRYLEEIPVSGGFVAGVV
ncbi:MAG: hypothetical protein ACRDPK_00555 [Carbonactinosporaceae bacterium]